MTWIREDGKVISSAKTQILKIKRVLSSDEGVYYCRASNPVGSVSGSVSLIVHGELISIKCNKTSFQFLNNLSLF